MKTIHGVEVLTEIEELVDPASTAMIVIDMQNEEVSEEGKYATDGETDVSPARAIIPNIQRLLDAARGAGVLVTYAEFIHSSRDGVILMDGPSYFVHRDDDFCVVCAGGNLGCPDGGRACAAIWRRALLQEPR